MHRSVIISNLLLGVASVSLACTAVRAQGYGPYLEVSKTEAGFTVEAEDASLPQVLSALGEKAGFTVHDSGAERPLMPVFEVRDATLEATLRRLLGSSNHLIVYRGDRQGKIEDGSIEKIVLLSPGKREPVSERLNSSLAGPATSAPPPPPPAVGRDPDEDPSAEMAQPSGEGLAGDPQEQVEFGAALEAMEQRMIEQFGVNQGEVAGGEPGGEPILPPGLLEKLEAAAYANGGEAIPPLELTVPEN